jgi:hypothetical protein
MSDKWTFLHLFAVSPFGEYKRDFIRQFKYIHRWTIMGVRFSCECATPSVQFRRQWHEVVLSRGPSGQLGGAEGRGREGRGEGLTLLQSRILASGIAQWHTASDLLFARSRVLQRHPRTAQKVATKYCVSSNCVVPLSCRLSY